MFNKSEVQSQGNYEISQEIARIFRNITNKCDSSEAGNDWHCQIRSTMTNAFNSLEKLSASEQDALFAI